MKYGVRKPSIKKSFKARTTGKINRKMKSAIDPTYGKKGMGYIKNPEKAVYNKIYNHTTVSVRDVISSKNDNNKTENNQSYAGNNHKNVSIYKKRIKYCLFSTVICIVLNIQFLNSGNLEEYIFCSMLLIFSITLMIYNFIKKKS